MDDGDPCWLSVAQAGVLVKKSKLGIMGAILYDEKNIYKAATNAQRLAEVYTDGAPEGMTNLVLKAFTNTIMECSTLAEVARILNEKAHTEVS